MLCFVVVRLDENDHDVAAAEFQALLTGGHHLTRAIRMPMRSILMRHIQWFANRMPSDFDLCGASIGNLIITGCFLEHDNDIVTAIYLIWNLLGVKGKVRPMTCANLHIRTLYDDGTEEVGQHLMGKRDVASKIKKIDLVKTLHSTHAQTCHLDVVSAEYVLSSDVIAFPMGSFFGSVIVNLLPAGVGRAIMQCKSPKVYVPNTGVDPEMFGYTLVEMIRLIIDMVEEDVGSHVRVSDILNFVVIDTKYCEYCVPIDKDEIEELGIVVIDIPLVEDSQLGRPGKSKKLDPTKVAEILVTLGS
jgi:CofD-related protein of GAK system